MRLIDVPSVWRKYRKSSVVGHFGERDSGGDEGTRGQSSNGKANAECPVGETYREVCSSWCKAMETILERQRYAHEDIERLEKAVTDRMLYRPRTVRLRLHLKALKK